MDNIRPDSLPQFITALIYNGDRAGVVSFAEWLRQTITSGDASIRVAKMMQSLAQLAFMDKLPDVIVAQCMSYIGWRNYIMIPRVCKRFQTLSLLPSSLPLTQTSFDREHGSSFVSLVSDIVSPYSVVRSFGDGDDTKRRSKKNDKEWRNRVGKLVVDRLFNSPIVGVESLRISSRHLLAFLHKINTQAPGKLSQLRSIAVEWQPRDTNNRILSEALVDLMTQHAPLLQIIEVYTYHAQNLAEATPTKLRHGGELLIASSMRSESLELAMLSRYNQGHGGGSKDVRGYAAITVRWNGSLPSRCTQCKKWCYGYVCSPKGPCRNPLAAGRCHKCFSPDAKCRVCKRRFHLFDNAVCTAIGEACSLSKIGCDHCVGGIA